MLIFNTLAEMPAYLVGLLVALVPSGDAVELAAPAAASAADDEHDPNTLYIERVKADGTGCVDKSKYSVSIDSDRNSFMVMYNDMKLENPNEQGDTLQSRNCLVSVRLHIPGGLQIALARVISRGNATLAEGVTARATSRYWFAGESVGGEDSARMTGPYEDAFKYHGEVPLESLVWSPCGEPAIFAIDNQVTLNATNNPAGPSEITMIDSEGEFSQVVYWKIQECDE